MKEISFNLSPWYSSKVAATLEIWNWKLRFLDSVLTQTAVKVILGTDTKFIQSQVRIWFTVCGDLSLERDTYPLTTKETFIPWLWKGHFSFDMNETLIPWLWMRHLPLTMKETIILWQWMRHVSLDYKRDTYSLIMKGTLILWLWKRCLFLDYERDTDP